MLASGAIPEFDAMSFALIDDDAGTVPITVVRKKELRAWLEGASERERDWLAATGFAAAPGKIALVPGKSGGIGRALVGLGDDDPAIWALGDLPAALPPAITGSMRHWSVAMRPAWRWLGSGYVFVHPLPRPKAERRPADMAERR